MSERRHRRGDARDAGPRRCLVGAPKETLLGRGPDGAAFPVDRQRANVAPMEQRAQKRLAAVVTPEDAFAARSDVDAPGSVSVESDTRGVTRRSGARGGAPESAGVFAPEEPGVGRRESGRGVFRKSQTAHGHGRETGPRGLPVAAAVGGTEDAGMGAGEKDRPVAALASTRTSPPSGPTATAGSEVSPIERGRGRLVGGRSPREVDPRRDPRTGETQVPSAFEPCDPLPLDVAHQRLESVPELVEACDHLSLGPLRADLRRPDPPDHQRHEHLGEVGARLPRVERGGVQAVETIEHEHDGAASRRAAELVPRRGDGVAVAAPGDGRHRDRHAAAELRAGDAVGREQLVGNDHVDPDVGARDRSDLFLVRAGQVGNLAQETGDSVEGGRLHDERDVDLSGLDGADGPAGRPKGRRQRLVGARIGRREERHGLERGLRFLGIGRVERARVRGARAVRKLGVGDEDLGTRLRSERDARVAFLAVAVPHGRSVEGEVDAFGIEPQRMGPGDVEPAPAHRFVAIRPRPGSRTRSRDG